MQSSAWENISNSVDINKIRILTRALARRLLPIGIQTFREIRERNCYYVDKTGYALRLVEGGKHYFLSRPRRFGKSLFLDTLKELFEGSRELFEGLRIYEHWDWSVRCPAVRLDFSGVNAKDPGDLNEDLQEQLDAIESDASVQPRHNTARGRFRHLLRTLHRQTGRRVAVLVDEYDKPILDALEEPDIAREPIASTCAACTQPSSPVMPISASASCPV